MQILKVYLVILLGLAGSTARASLAYDLVKPSEPPAVQIKLPERSDVEHALEAVLPETDDALVIGIFTPSGTRTYGFGSISGRADGSPAPDGDTVFEIASISKTFTGTLLAKLVLEGKIDLNQPIERYLPKSVHVPSSNGVPITVLDLATHRSGLPRDVDDRQPFEPYDTARVYEHVSNMKELGSVPGGKFLYSNLGVTLLGDALANEEGSTFGALLQKEICEPLHLQHTGLSEINQTDANCAQGHYGQFDLPLPPSVPLGGGGAGGMRSTANDLLRYLSAYAGLTHSDLDSAMALAVKPERSTGEKADIGLCWMINKRYHLILHTGKVAGFRSVVAFSPTQRVGIVVLGASNQMAVEEIAKCVASMILRDATTKISAKN